MSGGEGVESTSDGDKQNHVSGVRSRSRVVLALLLALTQGCASFVAAKGPPPAHERAADFQCSTSYVPAIIDSALLGVVGGLALTSIIRTPPSQEPGDKESYKLVLSTMGIWSAVAATSAMYGYSQAISCRKARGNQLAWQSPTEVPRAPWPGAPLTSLRPPAGR